MFCVVSGVGNVISTHGGNLTAAVHALFHGTTGHFDVGVALDASVDVKRSVASSATEHVTIDGAAIDIDIGVMFHQTDLAAAIHIAFNIGCLVDVYLGVDGGGES